MSDLQLVQQQAIGLNQEALDEWIAYRREDCKKPMSQRAIDRVVKKLLKYSEAEQARLIDNAIEMEWKGIYWVEPEQKVSTRQTSIKQDLSDTSWAG